MQRMNCAWNESSCCVMRRISAFMMASDSPPKVIQARLRITWRA